MTTHENVQRDERTVAVENASYRWAFPFIVMQRTARALPFIPTDATTDSVFILDISFVRPKGFSGRHRNGVANLGYRQLRERGRRRRTIRKVVSSTCTLSERCPQM